MNDLKNYQFLFRMPMDPSYKPSEEELHQMHQSWGGWIGSLAQDARLVSSHQLGFEGKVIQANKSESVIDYSAAQTSGTMMIKALSLDEAVQIASACPVFQAGGTVEVRSVLMNF